jgi:hypothetical protein
MTIMTAPADTKLKKLIRRLQSPNNDHEAVAALRALTSELQARGRGFQELSDLTTEWDREDAVLRPPPPPAVDWSAVESVIKTYTEGKKRVTINKVGKALNAHVPVLEQHRRGRGGFEFCLHEELYIHCCLQRLGFRKCGEMTYERRT